MASNSNADVLRFLDGDGNLLDKNHSIDDYLCDFAVNISFIL